MILDDLTGFLPHCKQKAHLLMVILIHATGTSKSKRHSHGLPWVDFADNWLDMRDVWGLMTKARRVLVGRNTQQTGQS